MTASLFNPFGEPAHPYQSHSPTSAAAATAKTGSARQRARVLAFLSTLGGHGATDEEMQTALGMDGSTQRPRRVELVSAVAVRDSGMTRKTQSGRAAVVWVAVGGAK